MCKFTIKNTLRDSYKQEGMSLLGMCICLTLKVVLEKFPGSLAVLFREIVTVKLL